MGVRYIKIFLFVLAVLAGDFFPSAAQLVKRKPSKPLILNGVHDKQIDALLITGNKTNCIKLVNCRNIVIRNCTLRSSELNGIEIFNCQMVKVVNCFFENVATGIYAFKSTQIEILHNRFKNMLGPVPKGQMAQFNEVYGIGNRINNNSCQNFMGAGNPEDAINLFKTNGTAADPVLVNDNRIRGGGPSATGGGIMLGDNGGSYIIAKGNVLVDPGQYGMAIAGGHHITITGNKIFGRQQPFTNVGLYIWNQSQTGCAFNTVSYNQVNFMDAKGEANNSWNKGNCGPVNGWGTNTWGAKLSSKLLPANIVTRR